jgi:hypothetical protein
LDADACEDLLIGEGEEEFAAYGRGRGFAEAEEDDCGAEGEGEEICYYEGEEDL